VETLCWILRRRNWLDYERGLLGPNIGLGDLKQVATLNRMADEYGFDTISLGNVIGFAMEAAEKSLISEKLKWGDFQDIKGLIRDIAYRKGVGNILAEGVRSAAMFSVKALLIGRCRLKGLEITAYDCHAAPGMALAYALILSVHI
jgi:aldehyde:ferredoxin oxidoreductase